MRKLILLTLCLLISNIAYAYNIFNQAVYHYYNTGTYERVNLRRHNMYNDYKEYNKHEPKKFYCYIPNNKGDIGYLVEQNPFGTRGYVINYDGYMQIERQRCHRTDTYDIITSFNQK